MFVDDNDDETTIDLVDIKHELSFALIAAQFLCKYKFAECTRYSVPSTFVMADSVNEKLNGAYNTMVAPKSQSYTIDLLVQTHTHTHKVNINRKLMKFLSLSSINRDYFNQFCGLEQRNIIRRFINQNEL